jgi:hypothetical protein
LEQTEENNDSFREWTGIPSFLLFFFLFFGF